MTVPSIYGVQAISPSAPVSYGVNPNSSADKTQAALSRARWEDYKTRFQPIEQYYMDRVLDDDAKARAIEKARGFTTQAFDTAQTFMSNQQRKYGTGLRPELQKAYDNKMDLNKKAALSLNSHKTGLMVDQLQLDALSGNSGVRANY